MAWRMLTLHGGAFRRAGARTASARRTASALALGALFAFAADASAVSAQENMSVHVKKPGGSGEGGGGRSPMRNLPANYRAEDPGLRKALDEERKGKGPGVRGAGTTGRPTGEPNASTSHIQSDQGDKPVIDPTVFGIAAGGGEMTFLTHRSTNVKAATLKSAIEPFLSGDGVVEVIGESDVVFVRDNADSMADIRRIIDHADRPMPQVLVEAQMVELRLDKDFEKDLSLLAQFNDGKFTTGLAQVFGVPGDKPILGNFVAEQSVPLGSDGSGWSMARVGSKFQIGSAMRFLQERGRAKILSTPKMVVRRGFKGSFLSGLEIPYYVYSDENNTNSYAVQFKKVGIKLDVEPIIVTCDAVRMVVAPEASSVHGYTDPGTGTNTYPRQPIVATRNVSTEVEMKDGETIAIGGMFNTLEQQIRRGLPGFDAVPLVRHFFTSVRKKEERTQLVVFLTLKILDEGIPGGFVYPPTRSIPVRQIHDDYTHLKPSILGGEMEHKWDDPEAILPPRRVEVEYLADGRIAWNNPAERMATNFPESPCPTVPLVDPEDFTDTESPQRIKTPWTKPGWPENPRLEAAMEPSAEEPLPRPIVGENGGAVVILESTAPAPVVVRAEPVAHYCGPNYCYATPCAYATRTPAPATVHGCQPFCGRDVCAVTAVPAPVVRAAPAPTPAVYAAASTAVYAAPVQPVAGVPVAGLGISACSGPGECPVVNPVGPYAATTAAPGTCTPAAAVREPVFRYVDELDGRVAAPARYNAYPSRPVMEEPLCVHRPRGQTVYYQQPADPGNDVTMPHDPWGEVQAPPTPPPFVPVRPQEPAPAVEAEAAPDARPLAMGANAPQALPAPRLSPELASTVGVHAAEECSCGRH